MKKLIFMMLVLLVPIRGLADVEQFMIFDDATGTLTFAYEELDPVKLSAGDYGAHVAEGWSISDGLAFSPTAITFKKTDVKKVVFRPECVNVKLNSLYNFFYGMKNLLLCLRIFFTK